METKMGITETQEAIGLVKSIAGLIKDAKSDGKMDIFDAMKAFTLTPDLIAAIQGSDKIDDELADLSGEEKDLLLFDLKNAIFSLVEALA
jgi:hypothetical protein